MLFTTDQQTLDDLNIFGRHGSDSVFALFDKTVTRGGAVLLEEMFRYPLSDVAKINKRSKSIQYFASLGTKFPIKGAILDAIIPYLNNKDERTKLSNQEHTAVKKLSNLIAEDADTLNIHRGILALVDLFKKMWEFLSALDSRDGDFYEADKAAIQLILQDAAFAVVFDGASKNKPGAAQFAVYDALFRFRHREMLQKLLGYVYELDVCIAVAKVANERGFAFPKALPADQQRVKVENLYHPQVKNAVANSIEITSDSNVIFLTGANMAGKSTFMKSLSISLFLAHMGFPVAASKMEFAVMDGIYTTINLPDDLGMGASHFYAEVLRAKKVANELQSKNLFVVFDELFRGTNVKDAGEATIAFTEAFAKKGNSIFVISTHIIEAGDVLRERCENISFVYLPTVMEGTKPIYTYKLAKGITEDRHGMIIINNEGILKTLAHDSTNSDQERKEFIADKQTLADLNLLGKYKPNSIYSLFNKVQTAGGERLLQEMFHRPLTDADQINTRSNLFKYFGSQNLIFPFKRETFAQAESYLNMGTAGNYPAAVAHVIVKKLQHSFLRDEHFEGMCNGLLAAIDMLNDCRDFITKLVKQDQTGPYNQELQVMKSLFADSRLQWLESERNVQALPLTKVASYDYLLKHTLRDKIEILLNSFYHIDVYLSVSLVAKERGFEYAEALPKKKNVLGAQSLWHPALIKGVANSIYLNKQENMIFLTGANMAGKSTIMKALGIAVYLGHMGFPVAAKDMQFSIKDGLYSSINVPDSLAQGYSHFYAEVLRVKTVAEEVGAGKNLVVLFDELFKGTNVKDAYDGTLAVTEAFSKFRSCFYIMSTHITEVGDKLIKNKHIRFAYMPTVMAGSRPTYTYKLQEGITLDKQGMMIIKNERILELLGT